MSWSNITSNLIGTTGIALGTGQTNTTAIVGQITTVQLTCTSGAAYYCYNLTEGSYNDWFLPSKDELNKLYINRVAIGGFADNLYWSSSELSASNAWYQNFFDGYQYRLNKNYYLRVRAVRAF